MRGFDSVVMVEGPRVRSRSRAPGRCGQSSAATTSASVSAIAVGSPRPRRRQGRQVRGPGLAGQDEDPAQPDPLGRRDVGARVVADHREADGRQPLAQVRAQGGDRLPEDLGRRLAEDPGRLPVANSSPTTNAPASSVAPLSVNHHGLRCMARNSAPPRISRKATSMLRNDRSSPASPITTARDRSGTRSASASSAADQRAGPRTRAGRRRRRGRTAGDRRWWAAV